MAEDESVRFNRLSLLEEISTLFHDVADFSRIVTEGITDMTALVTKFYIEFFLIWI